jgi:hypothetical protein
MTMVNGNDGLVTVLAGYAQAGSWSPVTLRWIRAVRSVSRSLVLVFDQDDLSIPLEFADDDGVAFMAQRHRAYDFGSYRIGLQELERRGWLSDASHVLLCNDSVIGPLFDLAELLDRMIKDQAPVWGLTESYLYSPHLQSYFLLMEIEVALQSSVRRFFENVVPQPSRHDVIQAYELGFSRLIKGLDLEWKAWLPAAEMWDPRNGERMANATAYPCCTLLEQLPVIKTRALKEYEANLDGLERTCSVLAEQYPDIWTELWQSASHRRLWQEAITVAILLRPSESDVLAERVAWVKRHPHPNLKCLLAVHVSETTTRARLMGSFEDELDDGLVSILVCDCPVDSDQALLQLLASAGTDWVLASSEALWRDLVSLQLQLRQLAERPSARSISGSPRLWRREELFCADQFQCLKGDWADYS